MSGIYHFSGIYRNDPRKGDFSIRIEFSDKYPQEIPKVYSLDDKIDHLYHRNPQGDLCLGSPASLYLVYSKNPCLKTFFDKILDPYLYRWLVVKNSAVQPWGELSHGVPGIIESYFEILGVSTLHQVSLLLFFILSGGTSRQNCLCPCGSGKKLKTCHHKQVERVIRFVPIQILRADYQIISRRST